MKQEPVKHSECVICKKQISQNKKTCSDVCKIKHRNNRRKSIRENHLIDLVCVGCGIEFSRDRPRNGFCSRSCASKHHVANGKFDKWLKQTIVRKNTAIAKRPNFTCFVCNKTCQRKASSIDSRNRKNCCSVACRITLTTEMNSGKSSAWYGRKHSKESMEKQKQTLLRNHGVDNAYKLAKQKQISKGQRELYVLLQDFEIGDVYLEQKITTDNKVYFVDMLIPARRIAIEYFGDYWHCNPSVYNHDFVQQRKNISAKLIWEHDIKKMHNLNKDGYNVIIVWEQKFKLDKMKTINILIEQIKEVENDRIFANSRTRII